AAAARQLPRHARRHRPPDSVGVHDLGRGALPVVRRRVPAPDRRPRPQPGASVDVTRTQPDDRALASARLLIDLVTNTLDPGYAEAAARRTPDAPPRRYDRAAVAAGCLLVGFLLVVAYIHTHRSAPEAAKVHDR